MRPALALLLLLAVVLFIAAMLLYGLLLLRMRRPVSFFELHALSGPVASLGKWTKRLWQASIALALAFAVALITAPLVAP